MLQIWIRPSCWSRSIIGHSRLRLLLLRLVHHSLVLRDPQKHTPERPGFPRLPIPKSASPKPPPRYVSRRQPMLDQPIQLFPPEAILAERAPQNARAQHCNRHPKTCPPNLLRYSLLPAPALPRGALQGFPPHRPSLPPTPCGNPHSHLLTAAPFPGPRSQPRTCLLAAGEHSRSLANAAPLGEAGGCRAWRDFLSARRHGAEETLSLPRPGADCVRLLETALAREASAGVSAEVNPLEFQGAYPIGLHCSPRSAGMRAPPASSLPITFRAEVTLLFRSSRQSPFAGPLFASPGLPCSPRGGGVQNGLKQC